MGTRLEPDDMIVHFWPCDKVTWVQGRRQTLQIPMSCVPAIGDSGGDVELLHFVRHPLFGGITLPGELSGVTHLPGADIVTVAQWIVSKLNAHA